jgi:general secretion pathway protein K
MTIRLQSKPRGIALIIVMIVVIVLAVLAGGFAYSMKVETRLARNSSFDADMENLGRSGVELARYILAMHLRVPIQGAYTALNQKWANGPASTNELLVEINLDNNPLGPGVFSLRMVDMESKFNLSIIRDERYSTILQRALEMIGVDAQDVTLITESYLDWVDPDNNKRLHGAESDFYARLNPAAPYVAKNGPMDDISEFLLINGMTPEIYFGAGNGGFAPPPPRDGMPMGTSSVGLKDLFTTISAAGMAINANTASADVLQLLPGMDATLASAIIATRAGPDHADGTEDDLPFEQRGDLAAVPGLTQELLNMMSQYLVLQSSVFEVTVEARIGTYVRHYEALLQRRNAQDVTILYFRAL